MSLYWELGVEAYKAGVPVESADALSRASADEWMAGWFAASAARTANAVVPTSYLSGERMSWTVGQLQEVDAQLGGRIWP